MVIIRVILYHLQEFVVKKMLAKQPMGQVGQAQFKILFVILYFAIFAVMGLVSNAYFTQNITYLASIFAYIGCETSGFSRIDCFEEVLDTRSRDIVGPLLSISTCTLVLWPVMIIILTINPKHWMRSSKLAGSRTIKKTQSTYASSA